VEVVAGSVVEVVGAVVVDEVVVTVVVVAVVLDEEEAAGSPVLHEAASRAAATPAASLRSIRDDPPLEGNGDPRTYEPVEEGPALRRRHPAGSWGSVRVTLPAYSPRHGIEDPVAQPGR
jgi:hypothetical protein